MGRAAIQGMMARGNAGRGRQDAARCDYSRCRQDRRTFPRRARSEVQPLEAAAEVATAAVEGTRQWPAKRGRQSYAGDRTVGTLDPGIVAVAMMLAAIANEFDQICS